MLDWLAQVPALLIACALLIVPGLPAALLLRLRGVALLGGAVVVSLAAVGAASVLAPLVGMRWSLLPVAIVAGVITAVAAVLWMLSRTSPAVTRGGDDAWIWAGIGAAALGWTAILVVGISGPDHPSQLYDGLFHLNAVEFVNEHGDASPFHMTMAIPGATSTFYPTLWHAVVALLAPFSAGVVHATNVMSLAVVAVVWPIALAMLTSVLFPSRRAAAAWAPLAGLGFSVFPLGFLNWGVLYPNLLGTVQVPLVLGFAVLACRRGLRPVPRIGLALITVAAAGACALGHPSALLGAFALFLPYVVCAGWATARRSGRRARLVLAVAGVVGAVLIALLWQRANVTTKEWLPGATLAQAVGEVAFLSPVGRSTGLLLGPLILIAIVSLVKRRQWWILGSYGVAIALFLTATWMPWLTLRSSIVGVWYDDTTRVAALLGMLGLPLAGLGAAIVWDWIRSLREQGRTIRLVAVVLAIVLLAATHLDALVKDLKFMRNVSFRFDEYSQGLSAQEAELFEEADALLGPDSLVIGDPLTGAALLYAYTGHEVVFPHATGSYGADAANLARSLREGSESVCESIERLGVTHALDLGDRELFENHYTTYDGLHDLERTPILTRVTSVGSDAVLYEVTGCR